MIGRGLLWGLAFPFYVFESGGRWRRLAALVPHRGKHVPHRGRRWFWCGVAVGLAAWVAGISLLV